MNSKIVTLIVAAACSCFTPINSAFAQGTAFTYQGRLNNGADPATGIYDLTFSLTATSAGGGSLAGPVTNSAVAVTNGLFTVLVDFGPGSLIGGSNWLAISVRTNGGDAFTALAPRQQLTPTPYAVFAETANAAGLTGAVGNGQLANNSLTITAGSGLAGGGVVALGGATTLNNAGVLSVTGNADITASPNTGGVVLGTTATDANTASKIIKRDASGNFSAGTVTLAGNLNLPGGKIHFHFPTRRI